jgi:hypothetical protein
MGLLGYPHRAELHDGLRKIECRLQTVHEREEGSSHDRLSLSEYPRRTELYLGKNSRNTQKLLMASIWLHFLCRWIARGK